MISEKFSGEDGD